MLKYSKITVCHKPQSVMKGKGKGKGKGQSNFHKGRTSLEDKTYQIKDQCGGDATHACPGLDTHSTPSHLTRVTNCESPPRETQLLS